MNLERVYQSLPIILQNISCSAEGLRVNHLRYAKKFEDTFGHFQNQTFWSNAQLKELQSNLLQRLLHHCANSVPHYREKFRKHRVPIQHIRTATQLGEYLPVLTKAEVQDRPSDFVSSAVPKREHVIAHTSGTTGGGLRFATTAYAQQVQWAVWWRYRVWHGLHRNNWCAYFGGRSIVPLSQTSPPFWRVNWPGRQLMFSAYHTSQANLDHYLHKLHTSGIDWIHGYPSILTLLAERTLRIGLSFSGKIKRITVGAESLLLQQSNLINAAFGVTPVQHYGQAEAVANISQCPLGQLHVDEDFSIVEFLTEHGSDSHRIIGTSLYNYVTPFLRYDTQDSATIHSDAEPCPCGRHGRSVLQIDGRSEDYVVLKSGAKIGRMDHIFKDLVHIREAQIYQKEPGVIQFRIVKGHDYSIDDETRLMAEAYSRLGKDTIIQVEYVESLPRTKNGKLRFVVSDLNEGKLVQ
jgi:phenylacetate-CoA ligase